MHRLLHMTALSLVLLSAPLPVLAQPARPERPYRGLFGSGVSATGQRLTANATLAGGYDDNLQAEAVGATSPADPAAAARRGTLGMLMGSLSYSLENGPFRLGAGGGTTARYYPSTETKFLRASSGRVAMEVELRDGTALSASATVMQQPYMFGAIFPTLFDPGVGDAALPDLEFAVSPAYSLLYEASTDFSHRLSPRANVGANYAYRRSNAQGQLERFTHRTVGGRFTYNVGRGLGLRAGYAYGEARFASSSEPTPHHAIDAGVDFNKALSFSRRTTLSFQTGSAATSVRDRFDSSATGSLQFRATGNARLNREIGRTWNASIVYSRNAAFEETWQEPVFSDALIAGVGGLITRRVQFVATAQGALGTIGNHSGAGAFDGYIGNLSLAYAVSRFMNVGLNYAYYHHRFEQGVLLPPGWPSTIDRQSVRVGVTLWAPLFQRSRRGNAAR